MAGTAGNESAWPVAGVRANRPLFSVRLALARAGFSAFGCLSANHGATVLRLGTGGDPQTWLVHRKRKQSCAPEIRTCRRMLAVLDEAQRAAVERHCGFTSCARSRTATLPLAPSAARPDCGRHSRRSNRSHFFDPVGALVDGDETKPSDARQMLKTLHSIVRPICPDAALLLIAHAKVGREAVAQSGIYDAEIMAAGQRLI